MPTTRRGRPRPWPPMQGLIESDGVVAVVGPITSANLNAIVPVAESLKTPLLYATNFEGGKCSRYVFSFSTVPNQDMGQLLPYVNQTFGNTYFLLGADRVWPHQMFDIAQPLIEKLGGKIVGTQYTLGTETDFTPLIAQVAAAKPKVLLFALKGDGIDFIRQADEKGLFKETTVAFLGLSEIDLGIFRGKGQNMYTAVPSVATSDDPALKAFVAKVRARGRRRRPGVELCHDPLQHADRAQGRDREGRQGRQGGHHRRDGGAGVSVADRAGDDRPESLCDDEHVHRQDAGAANSSPSARWARSRRSRDANWRVAKGGRRYWP